MSGYCDSVSTSDVFDVFVAVDDSADSGRMPFTRSGESGLSACGSLGSLKGGGGSIVDTAIANVGLCYCIML